MEILVLGVNLEAISIIDTFESFIWTDRYIGFGDFEIYSPMDLDLYNLLVKNRYLWIKDSDRNMIIETVEIISDFDDGNHIKITGRSLESILDRRIIWSPIVINGSFQDAVEKMLNDNVISPVDTDRKIENFIFKKSTDQAILNITTNGQYFGENLYDVILELCDQYSIGFKVTLSSENKFVFELYSGIDRSYDQIDNPYVIFSPNFDNLIESNFLESNRNLKTISLVVGEEMDDSTIKKTTTAVCNKGAGTGLDRRELKTDASSVRSTVDDVILSDAEYNEQLRQKGLEDLYANSTIQTFEGKADTNRMYIYGTDFFIGDILQIENEYGITARSRITEFVRSYSNSGIECIPTFSII